MAVLQGLRNLGLEMGNIVGGGPAQALKDAGSGTLQAIR